MLELQLPPAPTALGEEAAARLAQEQANADATAAATQEVPTADQSAQAARAGVTEPPEQLQGEGNEAVVAALDDRPPPDPEIEAFCDRVRDVILRKRPVDEDALASANPDAAAREAGAQVQGQVQGGVSQAQSGYDGLQQDGAAPAGQQGAPLPETPAEAQGAPAMNAQRAAPDPISDEGTSLDNDTANADQQIEDAGMTTEPAALVQEGPIAAARAASGELGAAAAEDVAAVRQRQQEAIAGARNNMAELQARAQEALATSRATTVGGTSAQQGGMVESEEQMRVRVGQEAERLFTSAQTTVRDLLRPVADNARARWDAELVPIKDKFRSDLREVENAVKDRHSGVGGAIVSLWDSVTGLPAWVTRAYDRAETNFADSVCKLIRDISRDVNAVLQACERIVEKARTDIAALYDALPESLQTWAAEQQTQITARIDGLRGEVETARKTVRDGLIEQAGAAVDEVRREVAALRDKAKGLLGQIADAITAFLEDPARAIINGLLSLLGISPGAFWALIDKIGSVIDAIADDPMGFASNLVSALGKGFTQFFDNFGRHVLQGLVSWLFSGLGSVGVQVPTDLSLRSVITFFLQLMGLTWERIRRVLAKHIGEQNVALIEQAWSILSTLISQGPAGIFEMIKDALDPQNLLNMVLETAASYLVERVIRAVSMRILGMLNPAGAILQAIELIYRVVSWVMNNAAKIFALVETVVNGAADLVAGNIGGMANAVEGALARLVAPVIDFLAGLLGFGDLPDKIAQVIGGLQARVERVLDRVIGTIVAAARRALAAVMGGGRRSEAGPATEEDKRSPAEKERDLKAGMDEVAAAVNAKQTPAAVSAKAAQARTKYRLKELDVFIENGNASVKGKVNPPGAVDVNDLVSNIIGTFSVERKKMKFSGEVKIQLAVEAHDGDNSKYTGQIANYKNVSKDTGKFASAGVDDRRHIVSFSDMASHYVDHLPTMTLLAASTFLNGNGGAVLTSGKQAEVQASFVASVKTVLRAFFTDAENLWIGDASENRSIQEEVDPSPIMVAAGAKMKQRLQAHVQKMANRWGIPGKSFKLTTGDLQVKSDYKIKKSG